MPLAVPREGESHLSFLARQAMEDSERWFGDTSVCHSIPHHTLALCGEAGELANIVKKIERGSLRMADATVRYDLAMEATDVFTYLLNIAALIGTDLDKANQHVRGKNETRFMLERAKREAGINNEHQR